MIIKKLTQKQTSILKLKNIALINRSEKKAFVTCLKCGYKWEGYFSNIIYKKTSKCPQCHKKETRLSDEDIKNKIGNRPIKIEEDYKGNIRKNHKWKCLKCKKIWTATIASVCYCKSGCPNCIKLNKKIIDKRLKKQQIELVGEYTNSSIKTEFICNKCKHTWKIIPNLLLQRKQCPNCRKLKIIQNAKKKT